MGRGKDFERRDRRNFEPSEEPTPVVSVPRPPRPAPPRSNGPSHTGAVKWYDAVKGFGFITPSSGGPEIFVHVSAVKRAGLAGLTEGQSVEYELVDFRGKSSAENLRVKSAP